MNPYELTSWSLEATRIDRMFDEVGRGQSFEITRRGKPVAVVIGIDEYERFIRARRFGRAPSTSAGTWRRTPLRPDQHFDGRSVMPDENREFPTRLYWDEIDDLTDEELVERLRERGWR